VGFAKRDEREQDVLTLSFLAWVVPYTYSVCTFISHQFGITQQGCDSLWKMSQKVPRRNLWSDWG